MSNIFIDEVCEEKIPVKIILENLKNIPLGDQEEELPCYAAMIAEELHKKRITPTQLRRFYTYVKAIAQKNLHLKPDEEIRDKAKLKFLLPKLAGSVRRTEKSKIEPLYRVIASCLHGNRIQEVKDLELFIEFFEAILDYHETFR